MKKALVSILAGAGALVVWRRVQAGKAEQDLWAEATDPVPPTR